MNLPVIGDPPFYLMAIPAVLLLGVGMCGFAAGFASLNPPRVPTDRKTDTGALAAKTHPIKPLAA